MDNGIVIIIILVSIAAVSLVVGFFYLFVLRPGTSTPEIRDLMVSGRRRDQFGNRIEVDVDNIKRETELASKSKKKKSQEDVATKLFKAGYYRPEDRRRFLYFQIIAPVISVILCTTALGTMGNALFTASGLILGALIGYAAPFSWLERRLRDRQEETLYYLPLVIEQIAIGVSSSLDIGPCIAQIVEMTRERDSHNPVTEMFLHVEKLIMSGLNLEDALVEVGEANGMSEIKHAFMFLAQCARHGGEISRQLQELADAVMVSRQVQIEARIKKLPVTATLPLTCVFFGFFLIVGAGIFVRLVTSLGSTLGTG